MTSASTSSKLPRRALVTSALALPLLATSTTGAHAATLRGAIAEKYWSTPQMRSELGAALSDEIPLGDGGCYQEFEGGRAYWHPATGAQWVRKGGLYTFYHNQGGAPGFLGYPRSPIVWNGRGANGWSLETRSPATGARYSLEWENSVGAVPVYLSGVIGSSWAADKNRYGYPLAPEEGLSTGAAYQFFSRGMLYWNTATGTQMITSGRYARTGAGNKLRRTDWVLKSTDALIIADSQANCDSSVVGTIRADDPSWISQGLRAAGWNPVNYSHGAIGAIMAKPFYPSYYQGVVGNAYALPVGSPGLIYLGGSGNDQWVGLSFEAVAARYVEIIKELRAMYPGAKIVLSEVLGRRIAEHASRAQLSEALRAAGAGVGVPVVPSRYWVTDHGVTHLLSDSVHLSDAGHIALGRVFGDWLRNNGLASSGGVEVRGGIGAYYRANGGEAKFGLPLKNETASVDGGVVQNFSNGWAIYWTPDFGSHAVKWGTGIGNKYAASRWELGSMGYPVTDEYPYAYGAVQEFVKPSTGSWMLAVWSGNTGTVLMNRRGAIYYKWQSLGGTNTLGFPSTDENPVSGGAVQFFRSRGGGETGIFWSPSTGARAINSKGAIYNAYTRGGYVGTYGFPTTDEHVAADGRVKVFFSNGYVISWSAAEGVRVARA